MILRVRFIALLHRARQIWISSFVLRTGTECWHLIKVLWCDEQIYQTILNKIIRRVWPPP